MKPIIAVPLGDPAGIGPEITVKSVASPEVQDAARVLVVGDADVVTRALEITHTQLRILISLKDLSKQRGIPIR